MTSISVCVLSICCSAEPARMIEHLHSLMIYFCLQLQGCSLSRMSCKAWMAGIHSRRGDTVYMPPTFGLSDFFFVTRVVHVVEIHLNLAVVPSLILHALTLLLTPYLSMTSSFSSFLFKRRLFVSRAMYVCSRDTYPCGAQPTHPSIHHTITLLADDALY